MLHLKKNSPRNIGTALHPSAVWSVVEAPGIILAREWMPGALHQDWVIMFDQFLEAQAQRLPWAQSQDIQAGDYSEVEANQIHCQLVNQRFATRQQALQAVEAALLVCATERATN